MKTSLHRECGWLISNKSVMLKSILSFRQPVEMAFTGTHDHPQAFAIDFLEQRHYSAEDIVIPSHFGRIFFLLHVHVHLSRDCSSQVMVRRPRAGSWMLVM